ncbi:MAG: helix-turn-helix transcriptional regulator [Bacteroidaceae bacterium]|nr:helix-turn-helix transcriptional regulator [Bacteroidaceae bacterium]
MKDRIRIIMDEQGMNQKEFCAKTGISQSTLSGILNGRSTATLPQCQAVYKHFPQYSFQWLVFGDGEPCVTPAQNSAQESGETPETSAATPAVSTSLDQQDFFGTDYTPAPVRRVDPVKMPEKEPEHPTIIPKEVVKYIDKPQRKITEIRIFFDDGTYEVFPNK